jgi:cytochrome c peroxidase
MTSKFFLLFFFLSAGLFTATMVDDKDDEVKAVLPVDSLPAEIELHPELVGFEGKANVPTDNEMTHAKVALGRRLFFDPILSKDRTVSCASCHQPEYAFASPDEKPIGIEGQLGRRNAPTILNRAYGEIFSWDGRDDSLEQQALGPLTSDSELGGDLDAVLVALRGEESYVKEFGEVFTEVDSSNLEELISERSLAMAIACFERTLVSGNSAVDQFRAAEYEALSQSARQGLWIFESRGGCWKCHSGQNFTDEEFHNTGVEFGVANRDEGRFEHTKNEADKFTFKTPTLRDVEHTGPYMHDGSVKSLREVVEFYNKGGHPDDPGLDKKMKPLKLTDEEVGFLVDFLKALSGNGALSVDGVTAHNEK